MRTVAGGGLAQCSPSICCLNDLAQHASLDVGAGGRRGRPHRAFVVLDDAYRHLHELGPMPFPAPGTVAHAAMLLFDHAAVNGTTDHAPGPGWRGLTDKDVLSPRSAATTPAAAAAGAPSTSKTPLLLAGKVSDRITGIHLIRLPPTAPTATEKAGTVWWFAPHHRPLGRGRQHPAQDRPQPLPPGSRRTANPGPRGPRSAGPVQRDHGRHVPGGTRRMNDILDLDFTQPPAPAPAGNTARFGGRWRLVGAGLSNVWRYGDLELPAATGRLLLRGPNGTRKTTALEALWPYLLDLNAAKLAAGKARPTTLRLLMSDGAPAKTDRRYGYVWLTFAAAASRCCRSRTC